MAKGQISDQDLESGIRTIGSLTGITSTGAKRDSPFGSDFSRKVLPVPQPIVEVNPLAEPTEAEETKPAIPITRKATASRNPVPSTKNKLPPENPVVEKGTGAFVEKITLQMSSEMRDDLNFLATRLQRRKTDKQQRITANTVMRVAIQFLLDELKLNASEVANTEEQLLSLMKRKILRREGKENA